MINGRYIVRKKIGEGRSKVFHVIDTEFPEREVAAKFLDPTSSEEEKQKFRDEFFTLQRLDHPGIIKSFDLSIVLVKDNDDEEIENNSPFITMEYFSATEILNYQNLKDEKQLNFIIKQICSVLYYLHQSNYIYYDLKAENILVTEDKNYPKVKLIDLGFATYNAGKLENNIKGTPQYIAPELLKNEQHNHTVDYYSLGILLYRIIFGKYPFKTDNELDIYKSQIENEFIFSESVYSKKLISVVSRLLKKNPSERFENAIEILKELNISIDIELVKDFIPAKVISARNDALNIINTYLKDKKSNEVFTITGFDGSGKSALLQEIYFRNKNSIFIENTRTKTGLDSIKYIFRKIILNELIHLEKQPEYSQIIEDLFNSSSVKIIETVKRIFNTLRSDIELILLFDDYNLYDNFTIETLTELIRIFQIKGLKVILTESSDFDYLSSKLNNLCEIQLNQFTDHQLSEFLDLSYYQPFPKRELKKYILLYSDLLPGNIKQFIKDLILLKVLKFDDSIVSFSSTEDIVLALQSSHEEIYRMRLSNLNSLELKLSQIISAFDISVEQTVLSALLDVSSSNLKTLLNELEKKNIIESLNLSNAPSINSFNFKRYIYSTISNRIRFHLILANSIKKLFPDFNTVELSRQYDLANEPEKAVEVLEKEIDKAEEVNAYSYKKELLEKSLKNFLPEKTTLRLTAELVKTLYKLSDYKLVLENLYKLKLERFSEPELHNLRFIKGSSLIELGNTKDGIDMLINLMSEKINKELSNRITVALALAEFDLNRFSESEEYCKILLRDSSLSLEEQGKANNLMAMIEVRSRNNVNKSLEYSLEALKEYELAKLPSRVAGMHVNIGILLDMQGRKSEADKHWNKALEINSDIGNLEQEGSILLNYGVFHHSINNFEKAIENFQKANAIFSSIGMNNYLALSIGNMGEVYLQISDFQHSFDCLVDSIEQFKQLENKEDELYFLYLLGKFWFIIGDIGELSGVLNKYELISLTEKQLSEKANKHFAFLKMFVSMLSENNVNEIEFSNTLLRALDLDESNDSIEQIFIFCEYLIKKENYLKVKELISLVKIDIKIKDNNLLSAYRYYLLGKIAKAKPEIENNPAIKNFEKAFEIIENESVTELTWKILFEITDLYWERGNINKSKKPRIYAYELINLIGENISNSKIRSAYFNHPIRKIALDKLKLIGNQVQINEFQQS